MNPRTLARSVGLTLHMLMFLFIYGLTAGFVLVVAYLMWGVGCLAFLAGKVGPLDWVRWVDGNWIAVVHRLVPVIGLVSRPGWLSLEQLRDCPHRLLWPVGGPIKLVHDEGLSVDQLWVGTTNLYGVRAESRR